MRYAHRLVLMMLLSLLAACQGSRSDFSRPTESDLFVPPPLTGTSQPLGVLPTLPPARTALPDSPTQPSNPQMQSVGTALPSETPACTQLLTYLADQTLPDGSPVEPGAAVDKRWLVENRGSCNWQAGYTLRLIAGANLGLPASIPLYPARSGHQVTLQIKFQAPVENGPYRSAWQAYDPLNQPFGDPLFIDFVVSAPTLPPPPETTPPPG